ncbi:sulfurtransferase complex subunit TusC [Kangiella shandongensis]|uniref:sulfurtransferase complex subunit TusC n=1 Tax=Kangiella shandongensis TaxID=2763258 RepID=UPI001CBB3AA9|nr:sulfurtransferase complex subunit TusC [Kangiella shandongensis]
MKRLSVIFNKAPYGSQAGRELLDIALMAAAFDMDISAIFIGNGVYQLLDKQQPDILQLKNHSPTFKALELYGIETILLEQEALAHRNMTEPQLLDVAELTDNATIQRHIQQSDFVFML